MVVGVPTAASALLALEAARLSALASGVNPLVPSAGEFVLGTVLSLGGAALWVAGLVSLLRSPLDPVARLPWMLVQVILPGLGALIWFWWRHRYYPARRAVDPAWDPNDRSLPALPPRRGAGRRAAPNEQD
ncbi:PLD nuclease N-terminal domain-containing protein [Micrococcus sp.]|uniref:PLD nuclease N-terminal domain-containing protein n=1 Tax=Micrococcus sp. TaxID=1271 RepID=UPI002A918E91|nr:PLD nuclease N-terminal domain-containing protein [Micrococcus sp.]MDY6055501.1 PLD nuclease N-terminal domain-containing protein [Micrococcus sp.]